MWAMQLLALAAAARLRAEARGPFSLIQAAGPFSSENPRMENPWGESKHFRMLDDLLPVAPEDRLDATSPSIVHQAVLVPDYLVADPFPASETYHTEAAQANGQPPAVVVADPTFSRGNRFAPRLPGGLDAPASSMPASSYPLRAQEEAGGSVAPVSPEDIMDHRYSKYFDQVHDMAKPCRGLVAGMVGYPGAPPDCAIPCAEGDEVIATLGNILRKVKIDTYDPHLDMAEVSWDASLPEDPDCHCHGPKKVQRQMLAAADGSGKICQMAAPAPAANATSFTQVRGIRGR